MLRFALWSGVLGWALLPLPLVSVLCWGLALHCAGLARAELAAGRRPLPT